MYTRRHLVDEITKDYIKLARIKGMRYRDIMLKHIFRNAFVPLSQSLPYNLILTISGSMLVEVFFSIPGMGPLMQIALSRYDTNVVQALVVIYASLGIFSVFLGDLLMTVVDPRITLNRKGQAR
jgi:oligopeptide transport system permease protein